MKCDKMFREIGDIDNSLIREADEVTKKRNILKIRPFALAAACAVLIFAAGFAAVNAQRGKIPLSENSAGVTVRYISKAPILQTSDMLVYQSERELITESDTDIFRGRILKISNIQLNFNGEKLYRAIAEIESESVLRGEIREGETVTVLLPCPVGNGIMVEDTDTAAAMREGMTGIFMPTKYADDSVYATNGACLSLRDVADYGFPDGSRYAFLETDGGLIFSKSAYGSLNGAKTLNEIEDYIIKTLG